jgi:hypothetical protein
MRMIEIYHLQKSRCDRTIFDLDDEGKRAFDVSAAAVTSRLTFEYSNLSFSITDKSSFSCEPFLEFLDT